MFSFGLSKKYVIHEVDDLPDDLPVGEYAIDIETTYDPDKEYTDPFGEDILIVAVHDGNRDVWVIYPPYEGCDNLRHLLTSADYKKLGQNITFDLMFLNTKLGVETVNVYDTLLAERVLNTGDKTSDNALDALLARRCGVFTSKAIRERFAEWEPGERLGEEELEYVANDVLWLHEIKRQQLEEASEAHLVRIINLENELVPVVTDMTLRGISFDMEGWKEIEKWVDGRIKEILLEFGEHINHMRQPCNFCDGLTRIEIDDGEYTFTIVCPRCDGNATTVKEYQPKPYFYDYDEFTLFVREIAAEHKKDPVFATVYARARKEKGYTVEAGRWLAAKALGYALPARWQKSIWFNPNSHEQVKLLLADLGYLALDTQAQTLMTLNLKKPSPVLTLLLEWSEWKTIGRWRYDQFVNPLTGKIHPSWNQVAADSGRFSCSSPNMTNVPRPSDGRPNFRNLFIPGEGNLLVVSDFAQQEIRVLAQLSQDPALIKAASTEDVYAAAGEIVYGKKITKADPERFLMKTAILGYFYGASPATTAESLGVTENEAIELHRSLGSAFPVAKRWGDLRIRYLRQQGFSETIWHRRRLFPELATVAPDDLWKYERIARNNPVQGTAADIAKLAMVKIYHALKQGNYNAWIRQMVHDEVVVECVAEQADEVGEIVTAKMLEAMETICPDIQAEVETHVGDSWVH